MVLGDGARDRGAACELISTDPAIGAGVAFVRLEADPDPVRVRAGWVSDADIWAMAQECAEDAELRPIGARHERRRRRGGPMSRARSAAPACSSWTTARRMHRRVPSVRLRRHLDR